MSEQGAQSLDNAASPTPPSLRQAGALLRAAREAQGMHIAALAVALKVPVKKLEALEAGQLELLPDLVFVRALALSICRTLKIDPATVMASLPEPQASPFKSIESHLNTTFKEATPNTHAPLRSQLTSPLGIAVVLIVVLIVAILAWPSDWNGDTAPASGVSPEAAVAPEPAVSVPLGVPAAVVPAQPTPQPATLAPASEAAALATAPEPAAPVVTPAPAAPFVKEPVASPAPVDLSAPLVLTASGESWVEVFDSTGQPRLRKLSAAGDVFRVSGSLPLSVKIGRADQIAVSVRGKPLDLTPLAKNNVASFEVK